MNLSSTVKIIQDIMRKDVGVDGDAQRIGQLSWMIFLKILDDCELEYEKLDTLYSSSIPSHLRWHVWTDASKGPTGDELISFVNNVLFKDLKGLPADPLHQASLSTVIRLVFNDAYNYMKSGYLMRQVIDKINENIHFESARDRHLFGDIYEKILRDLQSAGYAGEFYTPRAVTEFVVDMIDPKPGERILDPACGTGGFLTCSVEYTRKKHVKNDLEEKVLHQSIFGIEKKSLPHLLCVTNMMLHGIQVPVTIRHENSLARRLHDYKDEDQFDIIMTNPPFGGQEDEDVDANFPESFHSKETADLFLLLIMHLLKDGGRAAVVLPDGFLFGEGVKTRIKERLLQDCNLHTIVRLPKGVFNPYTDITTNILFFTKGTPTQEIWFYEHPYPANYKSYSKTKPIRTEEFGREKQWWENRQEGDYAWKASISEIRANGYNLDIKNPRRYLVHDKDFNQLLSQYNQSLNAISRIQDDLRHHFTASLDSKEKGAREDFFRNFHIFTETKSGIQKLRELLLLLAMQGKLVSQMQDEESSSALYKQIQKIKEKTVRKGEARQITVSAIDTSKYPFEIPETWKWVHLGDIAQIIGGGTPDTNYPEYFSDKGIPWLTPADLYQLKSKFIERGRRDLSELGLQKSSARILPEGAVLFSSRAPIGYVAIAKNNLATNQGFKSCVPYIMEMSEFIYYFLSFARKEIEKNAPGTTFKEVSGKIVQQILFPLPPLAEQRRIVAKLDELMHLLAELAAASESLQQIREDLVDGVVNLISHVNSQSDPRKLDGNHFNGYAITQESFIWASTGIVT